MNGYALMLGRDIDVHGTLDDWAIRLGKAAPYHGPLLRPILSTRLGSGGICAQRSPAT